MNCGLLSCDAMCSLLGGRDGAGTSLQVLVSICITTPETACHVVKELPVLITLEIFSKFVHFVTSRRNSLPHHLFLFSLPVFSTAFYFLLFCFFLALLPDFTCGPCGAGFPLEGNAMLLLSQEPRCLCSNCSSTEKAEETRRPLAELNSRYQCFLRC